MLTTDDHSPAFPGVRLVGAPHLLSHPSVDVEMQEGVTVGEMLDRSGIDPRLARWCHVEIDGREIPALWWDRVRPKAGRVVTVSVVPEGGDGDSNKALRTVLLVVVMVAALAISGGALAGVLGASFAAGGYGAIFGAALVGAGLSMGTMGLLPPSAGRA